MKDGFFIPNISKEDFLEEISKTVSKATKQAFDKLDNDKLLSQTEASKFLGVAKSTIIRWEQQNRIKPSRIGGRIFYKKSDLLNIGNDK